MNSDRTQFKFLIILSQVNASTFAFRVNLLTLNCFFAQVEEVLTKGGKEVGEGLARVLATVETMLSTLANSVLQAGLPIKNPPKKYQKSHLKKPTKQVFFCFFLG
jgi:hypothetical protein